ncbi:MAG: hypothetical protein V8S87_09525 [Oscillospiraceae bacterium]
MSAGKLTIREVAELSLFCALMVAGKECLRVIPNVHPVTLLLLLATIIYGAKALYPAFGFALLEIALYGAGIWNLMYLYVWPIAVLIALPFRSSRSRALWAAIAGAHGLFFGAMCAVPYLFIGGWQMALSWWISGIPYDVIHCVSNTVLTFVLLPPLRDLLERRHNMKND